MRTYHILYKNTEGKESASFGENFKAINPIVAYGKFLSKYPQTYMIFIGMYDLEALGSLKLNTNVIQDQADVDDVLRMNKKEYDPDKDDSPF